MARIINTADLKQGQVLAPNEQDWIYNGLDCCVTLEILHELLTQVDESAWGTYNFSRALQGPILEMSLRGFRVDQRQRNIVLNSTKHDIAQLSDQLTEIIKDGIGLDINWRSPAQLKHLLYDVLGLKPIKKRNAHGIMAPTTNREALEKLQIYLIAEPLCIHLLALRDLDKRRQFLETGIDPDGRLRCSFNIAGTDTGRLASSMSDMGTGTNLQNVDRQLRSICISDPGKKFANLDLEQADARNVGALCWELFYESHGAAFAGAYLDACESGDLHTNVCKMAWTEKPWTGDPKLDRAIADEIAYRQDSFRQLSKKLGHGCLTEDHEVLTPDGWIKISTRPKIIMQWKSGESKFVEPTHWEAKPWSGVLQIFEGTSISGVMTSDHRVPFYKDNNSTVLYEHPAEAGPGKYMPLGSHYVGGTEVVPARLIAAHMADGYQETNHMAFHLTKARKIQRLKKLCDDYGYNYKEHGGNKIRINGRLAKYPGAFMFAWTTECLKDFIDELKFWDGSITETAVSISSTRRDNLEWFQTFGRLVGIGGNISKSYTSGFGSTVYRLQQNNRQLASGASVKHTTQQVTNVMVYCPTVESGWFYVRHNGKIFITGNTNYYGTPPTMAKHTKVAVKLIKKFQERYFKGFPCISAWHEYVRNEIRTTGILVTPFGRRRMFHGRAFDDNTLRAAIAHSPQSMTGDEINTGLIKLFRANRVELLNQVHDNIIFQYDEKDEEEIIPWAIETLRTTLHLKGGRDFTVPVDAKIGWNWADEEYDKTGKVSANAGGLAKWKGKKDQRQRPEASGLSLRNLLK